MNIRLISVLALFTCGAASAGAQAEEPPAGSYLAQCEAAWKTDEEMREYYPCTEALGFDPDLYFLPVRNPEPHPLQSQDLVQATFSPGSYSRESDWSFAVRLDCPASVPKCDWQDRRPILRAVTWKSIDQLPADWKYPPVRSREDALQLLATAALWREADLRACPGGVEKLLTLLDIDWIVFDQTDYELIQGNRDVTLIVPSGHSDHYLVRAASLTHTTVSNDLGYEGSPGAWSREMMKLVEPCLKPLSLPPPWEH